MDVYMGVVCCHVEVSAWGWSLVQKSPTDCCVIVCYLKTLWMRRPWPNEGLSSPKQKIVLWNKLFALLYSCHNKCSAVLRSKKEVFCEIHWRIGFIWQTPSKQKWHAAKFITPLPSLLFVSFWPALLVAIYGNDLVIMSCTGRLKSLCAPVGKYALQQITPLSQHTSFLPHYLAQSDFLAADRQGQGDTTLTLT
jgi:hypothetical protein